MFNFLKPTTPKAPNYVDEFWEQIGQIPNVVGSKLAANWVLHHPLDVALDYTRRYRPEILQADDQLKAFVHFWMPTSLHRADALMALLSRQACWERTSIMPFTAKRRVLPMRIEHDTFQFMCILSTFNGHVGMIGRFSNPASYGGRCRNRSMHPMVDGKWIPAEEDALTQLASRHQHLEFREPATVKLLQCMLLTLMSPQPHMSFVIGFPELDSAGKLHFKSVSQLRSEQLDALATMEQDHWFPKLRDDEGVILNDRKSLSQAMLHQRLARIPRASTPTRYQRAQRGMTTQVVYEDDPALAVSVAAAIASISDPAFAAGRRGDDAVANDIAHGMSCHADRSPEPTYHRSESVSHATGGNDNQNVDCGSSPTSD